MALRLQEDEAQRCREQFLRDGFLVLRSYFSPREVDQVIAATEVALRDRAMEIVVDSLATNERTFYALATEPNSINFKFNDLFLLLPPVRAMALEPGLVALLRLLLGDQSPVLCNTLTLQRGSNQPMHIDSLFMTPHTPRQLAATWMAFEDVDPTAGPLEYYPSSHNIPLYRFRDGSHHATKEELPQWHQYIEREVKDRGLQKQIFLAKKGDVFIWHSDLLHGGGAIRDPNKTRSSMVCHYYTEADCRQFSKQKLESLNGGFWIDRLPQSVRVPPEQFGNEHPFPEETYLRRNPDLRRALEDGRIGSGFDHYRIYGYAEGRAI